MPKFVRKRNLVDPETGENFLSDERISVVGRTTWDRGRFVKLFIPCIDVLRRLKPSEFQLAMYVLSKLKSGSRELTLSFSGYSDWYQLTFMKAPDKSTYHKALNALVKDELLIKVGKGYLINHKMAFVGNRGKFLYLDSQIGKLT